MNKKKKPLNNKLYIVVIVLLIIYILVGRTKINDQGEIIREFASDTYTDLIDDVIFQIPEADDPYEMNEILYQGEKKLARLEEINKKSKALDFQPEEGEKVVLKYIRSGIYTIGENIDKFDEAELDKIRENFSIIGSQLQGTITGYSGGTLRIEISEESSVEIKNQLAELENILGLEFNKLPRSE